MRTGNDAARGSPSVVSRSELISRRDATAYSEGGFAWVFKAKFVSDLAVFRELIDVGRVG